MLALAAFVYRPLWTHALQLPSAHQFESWLFRPSQLPALLVLAVAAWMVWLRRARLRCAHPIPRQVSGVALALLSTALYLWALLTATPDLLLASLAAALLAFSSFTGGRRGRRAALLPAGVLVLGMPIPAPVRHEIVWSLQRATAASSAWLLEALGPEIVREGVLLHRAGHTFHVIDGCSGLQGITTLTLVAVIIGELLGLAALRRWILAAAALLFGYALNAVRIALIAASADPAAVGVPQSDHTPQGVAVLAAGTAILYGLGLLLAKASRAEAGSRSTPPAASPPWRLSGAWLAALALLSIHLPPFPPRTGPFPPEAVAFPSGGSGWTSEATMGDPFFLGPLPASQVLQRRFERRAEAPWPNTVELLIAMDDEGASDAGHLLSSKRLWPGPEWNVQRRRRIRVWELARDADFAVAARASGPERAVIYSWRVRDQGWWRESLRSLLALEASAFRRDRKRAVVRLVAFAPFDQPLALDRAKQRLDRFITAFRAPLEAL